MQEKIEELLTQVTLEEKVAMAAGADFWHNTGVERLGIPPIKVTDGPNGARGGDFGGGVGSACFPVAICLGATWPLSNTPTGWCPWSSPTRWDARLPRGGPALRWGARRRGLTPR